LAFGNNRADAIGVLTINSGTVVINQGSTTATDQRSYIALGRDSATGTINLNGGMLATDRNFVRDGSGAADTTGAANFVFGGGTLKALAAQPDWLNSTTRNTNQLALTSVTTTANSTIDSNGFAVGINNAISGAGGFTIVDSSAGGGGVVTFGGVNTYTGDTNVSAGKLIVSGSLSGSMNIGVASGAKLELDGGSLSSASTTTVDGTLQGGGDGSSTGLLGSISVNSGGELAPGKRTSTSTAGTLAALGNVFFADGSSKFSIRLGVGNGTDNDQLAVSETSFVLLSGATLQLTLGSNYVAHTSDFVYVLINGGTSGTGNIVGEFAQGTSITDSLGETFEIRYNTDAAGNIGAGNDVVLYLAVPEPQTWALLAGGFGSLLFVRNLRRRKI
jgi:autotransporter-associated beta strand protein